jgi:hypothetical protein
MKIKNKTAGHAGIACFSFALKGNRAGSPHFKIVRFKWWEHVTRHKDAVAYFNKTYVATSIFPRELGKKLGRLKQERETSDYDDFYIASLTDAMEQYAAAEFIITEIRQYLNTKNIPYITENSYKEKN